MIPRSRATSSTPGPLQPRVAIRSQRSLRGTRHRRRSRLPAIRATGHQFCAPATISVTRDPWAPSLRVIALSLRSRKRNLTPRETIHFPSTALSSSAPALGQISHDGLALAFKTNCRESTSSLTLNEPKDRKLWSARESDGNDVAHLERHLISPCTRLVDKIIGPAFIGYGPTGTLDLSDARFATPFSSHAAFAELQAACQPEEWDQLLTQPTSCLRLPDTRFGMIQLHTSRHRSAPARSRAWQSSGRPRGTARSRCGPATSVQNPHPEHTIHEHRQAARLHRIRVLCVRQIAGWRVTRGGARKL